MSKSKKTDIKTIEEWLESDDELPDSYNERPETPSYMDDDRFNKIRFSWIFDKNSQVQCNKSDVPKENATKSVEGKIETKENLYVPRKLFDDMPRKGILKRRDIYCLQSVQNHLRGNVLLWFANFLIFKDLQSKFTFPRGCLVYENECDFNQRKYNPKDINEVDEGSNKTIKYKIVVKK